MLHLIDATALRLVRTDNIGICYADCPDWHGCDCPPWWGIDLARAYR